MVLGLVLRVSWICLLFQLIACFPARMDYQYPYRALLSSAGGPSPRSANLEPEDLASPLVSLQHEAAPQQADTENQSPPSLGTPRAAAGSLPSYDPNRFVLTYDSGSDSPSGSAVRSHRPWYTSPGQKTPGFPGQVQQGSGTGGGSSTGGLYADPGGRLGAGFNLGAGSSSAGSGGSSSGAGSAYFGWPFLPGISRDETGLTNWLPSRRFPDPTVWDSGDVPLGMVELPAVLPSSYIVQSSNGFERAREVLSHSKYSQDTFDHLPFPVMPVDVPGLPGKGPIGQKA